MADARQVGARVEELLGILQSEGGESAARAAEELVRLLLGLYGDGLNHIMAALHAEGPGGSRHPGSPTRGPAGGKPADAA